MKMNRETINSQQWVERYGDGMFRFALLRVNDEEHAEDIVQNTFWRLEGERFVCRTVFRENLALWYSEE